MFELCRLEMFSHIKLLFRAVYCILGACDIHDDHRQIATTADDYLWIKLWQLREEEPEPMHDSIHYTLLQSLVLEEYGNYNFFKII